MTFDLGEREKRRQELYWALRSRLLTAEEMREVQLWDYHLTVPTTVSLDGMSASSECYSTSEKMREFNDALLTQFKIRTIAEEHK